MDSELIKKCQSIMISFLVREYGSITKYRKKQYDHLDKMRNIVFKCIDKRDTFKISSINIGEKIVHRGINFIRPILGVNREKLSFNPDYYIGNKVLVNIVPLSKNGKMMEILGISLIGKLNISTYIGIVFEIPVYSFVHEIKYGDVIICEERNIYSVRSVVDIHKLSCNLSLIYRDHKKYGK